MNVFSKVLTCVVVWVEVRAEGRARQAAGRPTGSLQPPFTHTLHLFEVLI